MNTLAVLLLAFGTFTLALSKECKDALGMESRGITDGQISASSQYDARHAPTKARLNYKPSVREPGAWSAGRRDKNPWLQIDLRNRITKVTRVATQGRPDIPQWVTKYKLQYSDNGKDFMNYKMKGQTEDELFPGNKDGNTVVHHDLNPPIRARFIRFLILGNRGWTSMRVELYGCKETFQCPVCHAIGQNAETECDENVKYEVCNRNDAGCQLTKTIADDNRLEVKRKCSDKHTFNKEKEECGKKKTCVNTAFCTQSRCMATSPVAFQCPVCPAAGWKAHCLGRATFAVCNKPSPACFVTQLITSDSIFQFRGCGSEQEYQSAKQVCRVTAAHCPLVVKCNKSQCMAPFPGKERYCPLKP
ncbi:uncharacterized protein [Montipora foliosa]|uniref:uncharacterized protein n=1 Tax=Montipora foliosa TaxID=591990 RepID=UPI0035F12D59